MILLVDRGEQRREDILQFLQKNNFRVHCAEDEQDAIQQCKTGKLSLLIVSIDFVGKDWEFCKKLRNITTLPMVALAQTPSNHERVKVKMLGCDAYIEDFCDHELFLQRLQNILQFAKRKKAREHISMMGDLSHISLIENLQSLNQSYKTGCLHLQQENLSGRIFLAEGEVIHAEITALHQGVPAFFHMLLWKTGIFRFYEEEVPSETTIQANLTSLFLEWSRLDDELQRLDMKGLSTEDKQIIKECIFSGIIPVEEFDSIISTAKTNQISIEQTLENMEILDKQQLADILYIIETRDNKKQIDIEQKLNASLNEVGIQLQDAIVQRLISAFSLLAMQQLDECVQEKANHIDKSLIDIITAKGYLGHSVLKNLLLFKDENGESLIPDYLIQKRIGKGARTIVYCATNNATGQQVAIKVFVPGIEESGISVQRFMREAEISSELDHPNLVKALDFGKLYGLYYIVQEYIDGKSLEKMLSNALPETTCLKILNEVAKGLVYLWQQNIVHRDLTPRNILYSDIDGIKICDFGLSKNILAKKENALPITATGIFMGTPGYIAPESFVNTDITFHSDVYSLGMTMYVLITGEMPQTPSTQLYNSGISTQQIKKIVAPKKKRPEVSAAFSILVMKWIHPQQLQRCKHLQEWQDDLGRINTGKKPKRVPHDHKKRLVLVATCFALLVIAWAWQLYNENAKKAQYQSKVLTKLDEHQKLGQHSIENGFLEDANRHFLQALSYQSLLSEVSNDYQQQIIAKWTIKTQSYLQKDQIPDLQKARKCCEYIVAMGGDSDKIAALQKEITQKIQQIQEHLKQQQYSLRLEDMWFATAKDAKSPKVSQIVLGGPLYLHIALQIRNRKKQQVLLQYKGAEQEHKLLLENVPKDGEFHQALPVNINQVFQGNISVFLQSDKFEISKNLPLQVDKPKSKKVTWGNSQSLFHSHYLKRLESWQKSGECLWAPSEEAPGIFAMGTGEISLAISQPTPWAIKNKIKPTSQDQEAGIKLILEDNSELALSVQPVAGSYLVSVIFVKSEKRQVITSKVFKKLQSLPVIIVNYGNLVKINLGKTTFAEVPIPKAKAVAMYVKKSKSVYFDNMIMYTEK